MRLMPRISSQCTGSQDHRPLMQHADPFMGNSSQPFDAKRESGSGNWCSPSDVQFVAALNRRSSAPRIDAGTSGSSGSLITRYRLLFEVDPVTTRWRRPSHLTFTLMIGMAIADSPHESLTVSGIYDYITESFPYFRTTPTKWKNSVRHNLSQTGVFRKTGRPVTHKKGWNYTVCPARKSWLRKEMRGKRIVDLMQLQHQLSGPSVVRHMQKVGLLHPNIRF